MFARAHGEEFSRGLNERPEDSQENADAKRLLQAMEKDGKVITSMAGGNQTIAEHIYDEIVLNVASESFDIDQFCNDIRYRIWVYSRKKAEYFRDDKMKEIDTVSYNPVAHGVVDERDDFQKKLEHVSIDEVLEAEGERVILQVLESQRITSTIKLRAPKMIRMKLRGETLKKIGEELGVTESRLSQIFRELREKLPHNEHMWDVLVPPMEKVVRKDEQERIDRLEQTGEVLKNVRAVKSTVEERTGTHLEEKKDDLLLTYIGYILDPDKTFKGFVEELREIGYKSGPRSVAHGRRLLENILGVTLPKVDSIRHYQRKHLTGEQYEEAF